MHYFNKFLHLSITSISILQTLIYIHIKTKTNFFETGAISLCNSVNTRQGFHNISLCFGKSILNSYTIPSLVDPIYPTPPLGQDDTRSNLKRILTGLNSEFSFS